MTDSKPPQDDGNGSAGDSSADRNGARWFAPDLLDGRTALITGGGSGLGREMAMTFARLGANLAICGRRENLLDETASAIESETGVRVVTHGCDLRKPDAIDAMLDALFDELPIDILVNNAAANFVARSETLSHRALDAIVEPTLMGAANTTFGCGKRWLETERRATVLSIVTSYAWHGSPFVVPSAMAKAGLLAMTRSLASEWGPRGVRLNALAPGAFPTKGAWERLLPDPEIAREHETGNSLGRPGEPEELATLAAFLVSDASAYMQGECVTIDGGRWPYMAGTFSDMHALSEDDWQAMVPSKR